MGFLDKLKNVLFEDEDEVEEINQKEQVVEESSKEVRFGKEEQKEVVKKENNVVNENSVFQSFDEEEFDRIAAINKNRLLERDRKAREEHEQSLALRKEELLRQQEKKVLERRNSAPEIKYSTTNVLPKENTRQNIYNKPLKNNEAQKRFTPSPVISPVYGILDKNYRKEDILPRASSEGTLPKMMDVDNVRKKAFGILEKNMEDEPLKDFRGDSELGIEEIADGLDATDDLVKNSLVDVDRMEEELVEEDSRVVREQPKSKEEDSLEKDLFNLIDSMYENREEK